jgi:death on curing protein
VLNGWELSAGADEQERVFLDLAAGRMKRESFAEWVQSNLRERPQR